MTVKKMKLVDENGIVWFPKTLAEIVENNAGQTLGGVEAGAQINKLEKIQLNGVELTIVNKTVNVEVPSAAEYSMKELATPTTGYGATYQLTKDGTPVGAKINIPKDLFLQSAEVKTCTVADNPVQGYKIGDVYIDFTLANSNNQHIYLLATDIGATYTGGNGISISNGEITVDTSVVATKTDLNSKQNSLTAAQLNAVNSGITSAKVTAYDRYATTISQKADKATTLSGYGITDGVTKTELAAAKYLTYVEIAEE